MLILFHELIKGNESLHWSLCQQLNPQTRKPTFHSFLISHRMQHNKTELNWKYPKYQFTGFRVLGVYGRDWVPPINQGKITNSILDFSNWVQCFNPDARCPNLLLTRN